MSGIRIRKDAMTPALKRLGISLNGFAREVMAELVKVTPVKSGRARRSTRLVSNRRIHLDYSYAQVLDRGRHATRRGMRGSRQAPNGMTKPTKLWARRRVRQMLRARR
jgi:hypothetical protein